MIGLDRIKVFKYKISGIQNRNWDPVSTWLRYANGITI